MPTFVIRIRSALVPPVSNDNPTLLYASSTVALIAALTPAPARPEPEVSLLENSNPPKKSVALLL